MYRCQSSEKVKWYVIQPSVSVQPPACCEWFCILKQKKALLEPVKDGTFINPHWDRSSLPSTHKQRSVMCYIKCATSPPGKWVSLYPCCLQTGRKMEMSRTSKSILIDHKNHSSWGNEHMKIRFIMNKTGFKITQHRESCTDQLEIKVKAATTNPTRWFQHWLVEKRPDTHCRISGKNLK